MLASPPLVFVELSTDCIGRAVSMALRFWLAVTCTLAVASGSASNAQDQVITRQEIDELTPSEKDRLRTNKDRFDKLSEAEKNRLRQFHEALEKHPESQKLRQAMREYYAWAKTLAPGKREDLRSLTVDERIEEISKHRRKPEWVPLNRQDAEIFRKWLRDAAEPHREALAQYHERVSDGRRGDGHRDDHRRGNRFEDDRHDDDHDGGRRRGRRGPPSWMRATFYLVNELLDENDFHKLSEQLSKSAASELKSRHDLASQRRLAFVWMLPREPFRRERRQDEEKISHQELEEFFSSPDELNNEMREVLLSLPRDEMDRQLRQLYLESRRESAEDGKPPFGPDWWGRRREPKSDPEDDNQK